MEKVVGGLFEGVVVAEEEDPYSMKDAGGCNRKLPVF